MASAQQWVMLVNSSGGEIIGTSQQAFSNSSASGNTAVVAGVVGRRYAVVSGLVTNNSTSAEMLVNFQSGSTAISATHMLATGGGGWALTPALGAYHFVTSAGSDLNVNLSDTGSVGIDLVYYELDA